MKQAPTVDEIQRIEHRLSLHDLRVLMVVAQAGSMSGAAKLLATERRVDCVARLKQARVRVCKQFRRVCIQFVIPEKAEGRTVNRIASTLAYH